MAKRNSTYTVELRWFGDEWSVHWIEVRAPDIMAARFVAIGKLKEEWDIDTRETAIYCTGIFKGSCLYKETPRE